MQLDRLRKNLPLIEEKLGYSFKNSDLLILAFTHRSFVNEHRQLVETHNERLEFLGDAVLGLVVSAFLYERLPDYSEGPLSQFRSRIVDAQACAYYLQKLLLPEYILLGRGESLTEGKAKTSILADAFEAIVGAIFIDGGMAMAKGFLLTHFQDDMEVVMGTPSRNYKAELQDYSQKKFRQAPLYKVMLETGPDHAKVFHISVWVDDKEVGMGIGESKKEAEQRAAFEALGHLGVDRHG